MAAALESVAEEGVDNIDFVDLCEELESLERRVVVQSMHIQQAKLEADEGLHQHEEQLEEAGMGTTKGLAGENLSGEVVVEKQFSDEEPAGVKTAAEWQAKATRKNMSWEVSVIFPLTRRECSELVCNRRTSQWSSWTR
jgi:hypothetical protein